MNPIVNGSNQPHLPKEGEKILDFTNLSPAQKYLKSSKIISQAFQTCQIDRNEAAFKKPEAEYIGETTRRSKARIAPAVVGIGTAVIGITSFAETGSRSAVKRSAPPKDSTLFLRGKTVGVLAVAVAGVGAAAYAFNAYRQLSMEVITKTARAFNKISNEQISQAQLCESTEEILSTIEGSWFKKIFTYQNAASMGYLLLTHGIALDSRGSYQSAQENYQQALGYSFEDDPDHLREMILFTYARSLRLSHGSKESILNLITQIAEDSPLYQLSQIERKIIDSSVDEVLEDGRIPFDFMCPITQSVMVNPTYHEGENGLRYYFENGSITAWVNARGKCPMTRRDLRLDDLVVDDHLANAIRIWNQIQLKLS